MHDIEECDKCALTTQLSFVSTYIIDDENDIHHCWIKYETIDYGEHGDMAFEAVDLESAESLVLLYSKQLGVNCKF